MALSRTDPLDAAVAKSNRALTAFEKAHTDLSVANEALEAVVAQAEHVAQLHVNRASVARDRITANQSVQDKLSEFIAA